MSPWRGESPTSVRRQARTLLSLLAVLMVVPMLPTATAAEGEENGDAEFSEEPAEGADEVEEIEAAEFEVLNETLDVIDGEATGTNAGSENQLMLWPEERRAYQFTGTTTTGLQTVVAFDLDTLSPVTTSVDGEERLAKSPSLRPGGPLASYWHQLQREQMALDRDRGRMFIPHRRRLAGQDEGICGGSDTLNSCLGGIHVIDLVDDALEPLPLDGHDGRIPFDHIGTDGVIETPILRAMSYADVGEDEGKLHLLVEEQAHFPIGGVGSPLRDFRVPQYIVQIDVATGAHDWVATAPGCSSYRSGADQRVYAVQARNVIFVTGDEEPTLYVGCYGPSQVGSVGRLSLDPDDPAAAPDEAAAFPGPANVTSMLADPDSGRIWMKSLAGGDEAWWAFDGQVGNYLGVVGIGERSGFARGTGRTGVVDPTSGRLYVMEGWIDDEWAFDGGLFVADGRRTPIPQANVVRDLPMRDLMRETEKDRETGEVDYVRDEDGEPADEYHWGEGAAELMNQMVVDPGDDERPRRLFFRPGQRSDSYRWYVIEDRRRVADEITDARELLEADVDDFPSTDDVEMEADGLVRPTFTGTARGYGLRTIMLGGVEAMWLPGSYSNAYYVGVKENILNNPIPENFISTLASIVNGDDEDARPLVRRGGALGSDPCGQRPREFGFGFSGNRATTAVLQPGSSAATATPATADPGTRRDLADPVGRCGEDQLDWLAHTPSVAGETLSDLELGIRDDPGDLLPDPDNDAERPGYDGAEFDREVNCNAPEFDEAGQAHPSSEDSTGDDSPVGSTFTAQVRCEEDVATAGQSRARFITAGPVSVVEAYSDYHLGRDSETGALVAKADAYARGISIVDDVVGPNGDRGTSQIHIDLVRTRAEAWAEGRSQPSGADDDCDRDRTAGTCLQRTLKGVTVVDGLTGEIAYECDECAFDNTQMRAAMDNAMGDQWQVLLREPDALLANGAPNGTQAAVQKREIDQFADVVMKGDLIKTLPGLEMVRINDNERGRGRQIYQFAGVELGTTYARQCRGVIEGEQCVQPDVELAEVDVTLTDGVDGTPLPNGVFGLHRDDEGTLGEGLEALPGDRTCTTDAQGHCSFVALEPGAYTLLQAGAPGDYSPTDEQVPLNLAPGSLFEVDVSNIRAVGEVEVTLTDLDEQPLGGGVFELYADADTDGAIGLDDPQAATCTTDPGGTCTMSGLPLDAYVLRQAAAPEGYAAVGDEVAFALDAPGQVATVGFSNAPSAPPVDDSGGGDLGDQATSTGQGSFNGIEERVPMPRHQPVSVEGPLNPQVAPDSGSGGPSFIQRMQDAPGDAIQMIRRNPGEAAGFAALALLAAAAVNGPVRRRLLTQTVG